MHCPVWWQKQTQLSHKGAARCKWNLYRLLKHTLIEYSAVVIFDPIWSQLSYKPLLLSKPKVTSPLSPKMREKVQDFLNARVSAPQGVRGCTKAVHKTGKESALVCLWPYSKGGDLILCCGWYHIAIIQNESTKPNRCLHLEVHCDEEPRPRGAIHE